MKKLASVAACLLLVACTIDAEPTLRVDKPQVDPGPVETPATAERATAEAARGEGRECGVRPQPRACPSGGQGPEGRSACGAG